MRILPAALMLVLLAPGARAVCPAGFPRTIAAAAANGPHGIVVADMNGDGVPDFVTANTTGTVDDTAAMSLAAIEGFTPNPAVSHASIAFRLPDARPAVWELLDIAGRRVLSGRLETGPGRHLVSLPGTVSPGVYIIGLTHAGHRVTTRGCLIR